MASGGARLGAGRKSIPESERKVLISGRVSKPIYDDLSSRAKELGVSMGRVIELLYDKAEKV